MLKMQMIFKIKNVSADAKGILQNKSHWIINPPTYYRITYSSILCCNAKTNPKFLSTNDKKSDFLPK